LGRRIEHDHALRDRDEGEDDVRVEALRGRRRGIVTDLVGIGPAWDRAG
jgi:hypothetical protein